MISLGTLAIISRVTGLCSSRVPDAIDDRSRRRWRSAIDQPTGEGQAIRRGVGGQRMQERRHARRHALGRLEEVAALQDVRVARLRPRRSTNCDEPSGCFFHSDSILRWRPSTRRRSSASS